MRSRVVLPQPLGPSRQMISPGSTLKLASFSTGRPGYDFDTAVTDSNGGMG